MLPPNSDNPRRWMSSTLQERNERLKRHGKWSKLLDRDRARI